MLVLDAIRIRKCQLKRTLERFEREDYERRVRANLSKIFLRYPPSRVLYADSGPKEKAFGKPTSEASEDRRRNKDLDEATKHQR